MIKFWLIPPLILAAVFVFSALASAALTQLAVRGGPVDTPRARGSHKTPTPTSGGMAVIAATALSLGLLSIVFKTHLAPDGGHGVSLFLYAALMGLSGAADDVLGLSAKLRLLFQVLLSLWFASLYPVTLMEFGFGLNLPIWPLIGVLGTTFWLVLGVNTINFMDGSNGLAVGSQSIALGVMAAVIIVFAPLSDKTFYAAGLLLICVAALGAHLGFLPFNLPRGKVFQGDAGSLFGGALITGGVLLLVKAEVETVWIGGYILAPLLVDVLLTLALRTRSKAKLFEAHKQHLYQQWLIHKDPSHLNMAVRVWALCALSGGVGVGMHSLHIAKGIDLRFVGMVVIFWLLAMGWLWLRWKLLSCRASDPKTAKS